MSIELTNNSRYIEREGETDWWEWTAYLKSDEPQELDEIEYVEYRLHPSFPSPVQWVRIREGGFPLTRIGWGTFTLTAKVCFKDKSRDSILLEHYLQFD